MAFNHYAKIQRILAEQPDGWYVVRINEPTVSQNFKNEKVTFDHYYRIYSADGKPIKYCKFQQFERFTQIMNMPAESIPVIEK